MNMGVKKRHDSDRQPRLTRQLRANIRSGTPGFAKPPCPQSSSMLQSALGGLDVSSESRVTHLDRLGGHCMLRVGGTSLTSRMHGAKRAPMLIRVELEGPIMKLNGFVWIGDPSSLLFCTSSYTMTAHMTEVSGMVKMTCREVEVGSVECRRC